MLKSRKAQFYIVIAIMLIVYLFAIGKQTAQIKKPETSFRQLYQNFMAESPKVINSGVYEGNLTERFRNFSDAYITYARTKSPDFRMAYALLDQDEVLIMNSLNEPLNVTTPATTFILGSGTSRTITKPQNLTFYVNNEAYNFAFTRDTELKALFKKADKNEVIIHVEG